MNYEAMMAECDRQVLLYEALTNGKDAWKKNAPTTECALSVGEVVVWLREQMRKPGIILEDYARFAAYQQGISYKRLRKAREALGAEAYWWIDPMTYTRYKFWKLPGR